MTNTNNANKKNSKVPMKSTPLRIPYTMEKIIINRDNVACFIIDEDNRRQIREGKVRGILSELNAGTHFSVPFVVNRKDNGDKTLDGNHRIEALKLKFVQDPNFQIEQWLVVYKDLTKEEEKEIYSLWNIGVTQTTTDFLKMYFETIPFGREMLNELPVTIYGDDTHLNIKSVVGSYIAITRQNNNFTGGYGGGREKIVSDFSNVTAEDIGVMKEFCGFMEKVFGQFHAKHNRLFYTTTAVTVLFRIWWDNHTYINENKMVRLFKKGFVRPLNAKGQNLWAESVQSGGRGAQILFYNQSLPYLNTLSKQHFLRIGE